MYDLLRLVNIFFKRRYSLMKQNPSLSNGVLEISVMLKVPIKIRPVALGGL